MGQNKNRVVVYIDGFNLYFGMMDAGFNHCKWLNIEKLVRGYLTAILISGDSDLVPPIKAVHQNFPNKVVSVFFPPNRHNNTVAGAARGSQIIGRKKLLDSQFEEKIQKKDGFILHKPSEWKP